jgi:FixJ family two-component response regulator
MSRIGTTHEMRRRAEVDVGSVGESRGIVHVVDDDSDIRMAMSSLMRSIGFTARTYAQGQDFLACERPEKPSCLLLDVRLARFSGFSVQNEMGKLHIEMPVIFITAHSDVQMSVRAMKAGAFDFLTKPFRDQEIVDCVTKAVQIDQRRLIAQRSLSEMRGDYFLLTPRQRDVMALIVEGLVTKQIAAKLDVSEITVKMHRKELMTKMRTSSVAELVIKAVQLGLCEPQQSRATAFGGDERE